MSLAQRFSGEIVSCDSVAVYRNFEIGTAKPSREDRARVPHHLIDVADPGEPFTAGEYARQARAAIREITELPDVRARMSALGTSVDFRNSDQFREQITKEYQKYGTIVRDAGIESN